MLLPGGNPLHFGMGMLMSNNFFRPPNNQTNFFKESAEQKLDTKKMA